MPKRPHEPEPQAQSTEGESEAKRPDYPEEEAWHWKFIKDVASQLRQDCPEFGIVVIGETGTGKSTLINNLLGQDVAPVGHTMEAKTLAVTLTPHKVVVEGVPVAVYDTPGLDDARGNEDEKEHLRIMKSLLARGKIHLIIYCFKMIETRMRTSLIRTFEEYHKIGVPWEQTVITLTFADKEGDPNRFPQIQQQVKKTLVERVGLELSTVEKLKICPTANNPDEALPTARPWFVPFWLDVVEVLVPAALVQFLVIHERNICTEGQPKLVNIMLAGEDKERFETLTELSRLSETPHVQVLYRYAWGFLTEMNCKAIAAELRASELIPESVGYDIIHSKSREEANTHLLNHLIQVADEGTVREVFQIAKEGYGSMKTFAAFMLQKEWQLAYKESLSEHGSVSVEVKQCVFGGPPAVGKSSLKHLLVHNQPKAVKTSTAVMDTPEAVTISSEQYAVKGDNSAWQLVSDDVMANSLQGCINARVYDSNAQYPSDTEMNKSEDVQQESSPMATELNTSERLPVGQVDTLPMQASSMGRRQHSERAQAHQRGGSFPQSHPIALLQEHHSQLLLEMGGDAQQIKLKDASFIHLLDTGGQPSFQVALPLLLDVPYTYIHVFNAARDLGQPVPITYRPDDHTVEVLPPSTETGWEMMQRSLSSMHTIARKRSKELASFQQEEGPLPQHHIFVVGTFKDQLVTEGRHEKAICDIGTRLRELEGKPYYHSLTWDPVGQPFYLINCMVGKGDDKAHINHLRQCLSAGEGSSMKLKVPVMWYMCKLITQRVPQKFFRFNDLKDFCLERKFIDASHADSQFRSLLKLFSLLGFYSFFDLKDVSDEDNFVCTDKGVFLKEVSKLLAVQFVTPKSPIVKSLKETGILVFAPELFQELSMCPEMNPNWFLKALCQLGIAARLPAKETPEYFIPAVLPHTAVSRPHLTSVDPLCVTCKIDKGSVFSYNDLPQGVFCHLAVELIRKEWNIIAKESTRTLLKFCWQEFEIFLEETPGYIAVIPQVVEEISDLSKLHNGCESLCDIITNCFSLSTEAVLGSHLSTVTELVVGFEYPCKEVSMHHLALPSKKGKSLICTLDSGRQLYSKRRRIWYSAVDGAMLNLCPDHKVWTLEDCECSGNIPAIHHIPLVQVLQKHAEEFLKQMNCTVIAAQLKAMELLPESVETDILHSKSREEGNTLLLNHLKVEADEKSIMGTFRIASEKAGYGKMNTFAAFMLRQLQ